MTALEISVLSLLVATFLQESATASDLLVRVRAGAHDRRNSPVTVSCTEAATAGLPARPCLVTPEGRVPLQAIRDGERVLLHFVLPSLPAGETADYEVSAHDDGPSAFEWLAHETDQITDLLVGGRRVLRYVHPRWDPDDVEHTKKPFHHVFGADGDTLLTKGAGGLYSHHRGIFFGFNQCRVGGKSHDIWHAANGERSQHVDTIAEWQGPVLGGHQVRIDWCDPAGVPFATEQRSVSAWLQPDGSRLIELRTRLETTGETVRLGGDRQHAGVQFRATQAVADRASQTRYLRPVGWDQLEPGKEINDAAHRGLPWNALQFSLGEENYTVAYLSDPANSDGAEFSERLYGRFGEFFPWELREDHPLKLRYRWWITTTEVDRAQVHARYLDLAEPPAAELLPGPR